MIEFAKPSVEYFELWPLLVVFGVACLGVVVEAFVPRALRYASQVGLALLGLVGALVGVVVVAQDVTSYDDGAARGVLAVGGTVAVDGRLLVRASSVGADTRLAHIARLVEDAQAGKSRVQRLADRISGIFVPIVIVLAIINFVA